MSLRPFLQSDAGLPQGLNPQDVEEGSAVALTCPWRSRHRDLASIMRLILADGAEAVADQPSLPR